MSNDSLQLLAVLLITHSRAGPKLIFHYPDHDAFTSNAHSKDSAPPGPNIISGAVSSARNGAADHRRPLNDTKRSIRHTQDRVVNDHVLGLSEENLEKLLSPGRWCDRKRFEVSLDDLVFVGHPVYANSDGNWTKSPDEAADGGTEDDRPITPRNLSESESGQNDNGTESFQPGITIVQPTPARVLNDFKHAPESLDSRGGLSLGASVNSESTASAAVLPEQLVAFHIVFAMTKSGSEESITGVTDLYKQVAKKLTKALIHCQKENSYVGVESRKLSQLKAKAKQEGWSDDALMSVMLDRSDLASALKEIYEKISVGRVAGFRIQGIMMSLQIRSASGKNEGEDTIDRHKTILLLEDKDVLLRELSHPDASPLAHFIREYTPTKSLQKQTARLGMPIGNLVYLAQHLIKWQKARAIQPLHPRNTYIVGREAPLDRLDFYIADYAKRFAALPSLPQVLKVLSGKPVQYRMLIPSRDHRAPYTDILAYLVRHKFIEQLQTSGWLQAPPTKHKSPAAIESNKNRRPVSVASLLSPQMRAVADDDVASVSSERTTIPISTMDNRVGRVEASPGPKVISAEVGNEQAAVQIVKDPLNPMGEERLCLEHIADAIQDNDLRDRLSSFYQYFDGEAALESIAAQEGLKRSTLEGWLDSLQEQGFLLTFRHL